MFVALGTCDRTLLEGEVVVYAHELDIDLNPEIGPERMLRGTPKMVLTLGNGPEVLPAWCVRCQDR